MEKQQPIYTEKTECQDCCKCVRKCPVKAIRVENGSAMVMPDRCVACGTCVAVCPVGAKRVRDDLGRVRHLLRSGARVYASLAPSFVSDFTDVSADVLIAALRKLGFAGVSETALGAQEVSATLRHELRDQTPRVIISSACPTIVELIGKYLPERLADVTDLCSPLLAHSRLLKQELGEDARVVFIGPCIAKKIEADSFGDLVDIAISFRDLREWMEEDGIDLQQMTSGPEDRFVPGPAKEGALYPVDGGMIAGIQADCTVHDAHFMAFSGVDSVVKALDEMQSLPLTKPVFLELLACEGGCVNGPQAAGQCATIAKRHRVIDYTEYDPATIAETPVVDVALIRAVTPVDQVEHGEDDVLEALRMVGKYTAEDELNCGGCGYADCREFAEALLDGKAEPTMCISYMKKLAQKKANALIQTMPSGVVIVQRNLRIVECNQRFAELMGPDAVLCHEANPGLEGALLPKVAPFFAGFFERVLEGGEEVLDRDVEHANTVYRMSIFTIERHRIVGGIIQDITEPAVQKEQVIREAQDVIHKHLTTVQKIAYLLGENAAESQISLNAIIDSFSPKSIDDQGKER
ncbi:MAG: 4Fe-4S binding protein [Lentisphaerae bacterium]|jgi:iron only hydrogenase large subunit-like protein|nr:4Fe-4S binding protein [Lentisphaerota bacterium]MBT4818711.1 4Fe-4S binding protein [Lentisphaerota bacterium]MBT5611545.1 4Fe-4S binding protein [Lentisphaerota bacterium]MBT7059572.1 4Fe-4S binding protein [Lentisphaerota bacterium]MBT7844972.1 4Fe-4S binding protein [Lentisphaerota bacterium]